LEYLLTLNNLYMFKIKESRFASSRRLLMLIWFCVSLSLKTWKNKITSTISFLKLCVNWVHVSLGIANNSSFVSLNVHVRYFRNLLLEKSEVKTLLGTEKLVNTHIMGKKRCFTIGQATQFLSCTIHLQLAVFICQTC